MSHKLLLADDSVTIQRVIELTFADEDIQLTAVGDGRQAIERIEADPPDIVLVDVGMPEKDGYEVTAYIKNNPRLAHIPVLLLTGAFEPVDEERARVAGCDGVLAKPFEPQMVISRVKELLAGAVRRVSGPRAVPPFAMVAAVPVAPVSAGPGAPPEPPVSRVLPEPVRMLAGDTLAEADPIELPVVVQPVDAGPVPAEASGQDSAPAFGSEVDAPFTIRRRQTMAVPESGVPPAPPPAPDPDRQAALDDYFERLDAAFTNLQSAPPVPPPPAPDEPDPALPAPQPPFSDVFAPAESLAAKPIAEPSLEAAAPDPARSKAPVDERGQPGIAQAFSVLLAAERGESDPGYVPSWFTPAPPPAVDVDELVDRVTRQVLDQMSDRVVRDTVTDIVSRVAERLVREEIDRIKASTS